MQVWQGLLVFACFIAQSNVRKNIIYCLFNFFELVKLRSCFDITWDLVIFSKQHFFLDISLHLEMEEVLAGCITFKMS